MFSLVTGAILHDRSYTVSFTVPIQAAHAAGATVIGYANKPHKADLFSEAQADVVTERMQDIAEALTAE
ncbi:MULTISPECIES: hypothetical protein [unclassified Streptomyces]|uniref:hypothetical protein n=1 Tax=unclassified Streptomyces TaxID=2593676 RepID=UPI0035DE1692